MESSAALASTTQGDPYGRPCCSHLHFPGMRPEPRIKTAAQSRSSEETAPSGTKKQEPRATDRMRGNASAASTLGLARLCQSGNSPEQCTRCMTCRQLDPRKALNAKWQRRYASDRSVTVDCRTRFNNCSSAAGTIQPARRRGRTYTGKR